MAFSGYPAKHSPLVAGFFNLSHQLVLEQNQEFFLSQSRLPDNAEQNKNGQISRVDWNGNPVGLRGMPELRVATSVMVNVESRSGQSTQGFPRAENWQLGHLNVYYVRTTARSSVTG